MPTSDPRTTIVEVELPDGNVTYVEARLTDPGGDVAAGHGRYTLEDSAKTVVQAADLLLRAIRESLDEAPSRTEVEFGIKLAIKSGRLVSFLAEAGAEASLAVKLSWGGDSSEAGTSGSS